MNQPMKLTVYHSRDVGVPAWGRQCWNAHLEQTDGDGAFGSGKTREDAVAQAYNLLGLEPPARKQGELF